MDKTRLQKTLLPLIVAFLATLHSARGGTFELDYENNRFLMDGETFRYVSGTIHYFRVPEAYWRDRLTKLKACGFNTVQTLVPWGVHEPRPGEYDFDGRKDLIAFIRLAHELGLYVLLAPGPYISGDISNGGLPWWLAKNRTIRPRTSDIAFMEEVRRWLRRVLGMVKPYIYQNEGPIIGFQVENEYGWKFTPCDRKYLEKLRDIFREILGNEVYLYTVDNSGVNLKCGSVDGVYATVNFGSWTTAKDAFAAMRKVSPKGPLVNSEFYPGWASLWGYAETTKWFSIPQLTRTFGDMLTMKASVNFYMFEGGSNIGYLASGSGNFKNHVFVEQSNDYGALLTENGTPTPKYYAIRKELERLNGPVDEDVPPAVPTANYGAPKAYYAGSIIDFINDGVFDATSSPVPLSFEDLDFPDGFVLYETELQFDGNTLTIKDLQDQGYVMLDNEFVGILGLFKGPTIKLQARQGQLLRILVENIGRHQDGVRLYRKGILGDVLLDGFVLVRWHMYRIELERLFDGDRIDSVLNRGGNRRRRDISAENQRPVSPNRRHLEVQKSSNKSLTGSNQATHRIRGKRDQSNDDEGDREFEAVGEDDDSTRDRADEDDRGSETEDQAGSEQTQETGPALAQWEGGRLGPSIYIGSFEIVGEPKDTFFDPSGWGHGQFLINEQNVGKYWPSAGPQVTLWVPGPWLREGRNVFVMLEMDSVPRNCPDYHDSCAVRFSADAKKTYKGAR